MSLERWTSVANSLPENDDLLLIVNGRETVVGYYDAKGAPTWRDVEGYPLKSVSWWAPIPLSPVELARND